MQDALQGEKTLSDAIECRVHFLMLYVKEEEKVYNQSFKNQAKVFCTSYLRT